MDRLHGAGCTGDQTKPCSGRLRGPVARARYTSRRNGLAARTGCTGLVARATAKRGGRQGGWELPGPAGAPLRMLFLHLEPFPHLLLARCLDDPGKLAGFKHLDAEVGRPVLRHLPVGAHPAQKLGRRR